MVKYFKSHADYLLLTLLFLWAVLSCFCAVSCDLVASEAHLWWVSQNLDWGYIDQSPLHVLSTRIGVLLGGDGKMGVRALTAIIQPITLYLLWCTLRREKSDYKSAMRFFGIAFSIPLLAIFGFISSVFSWFMFGAVVTIWAYKMLLKSRVGENNGFVLSVPLLSLGFAIMGYADYRCAVIVILAILISNYKLLGGWRIYAALFVALVLMTPHILWLEANDFMPMKDYVKGVSDIFSIRNLGLLFLGFFLLCSPFLSLVTIRILITKNPINTNKFDSFFRVFMILAALYLIYSTGSNSVKLDWVLILTIPIIYLIFLLGERSKSAARYIKFTSLFMGLLLFITQIMVISLDGALFRKFGLKGTEQTLQRAVWQIQDKKEGDSKSNIDLFITENKAELSSLINYYTPLKSFAMPSIYSESNGYQTIDFTYNYYGKRVAQSVNSAALKSIHKDSLFSVYRSVIIPNIGTEFYTVDEFYIPTFDVEIELQSFPEKVLVDQKLAVTLILRNPYPFEIPLGGKTGFNMVMHLACKDPLRKDIYYDLDIPFKEQILDSHATITIASTIIIPKSETLNFNAGVSLRRGVMPSWYNSEVYNLLIVNPKTRV